MYQEQEIQSKRTQFRNQIRRKQIEERFQAERVKFAESLIREEAEQICRELDTPQKKREWIFKKSMQMGDIPEKSWFQILRALSISMRAFNDGNFDVWIEARLIQKILMTLRQQYLDLDLSQLSACVIQDIFYHLPRESQQIDQILEYEFVIDVVELCANQYTPALHYYELISCMMDNRNRIRNLFIANGLVQMLTTRLKGYLQGDVDTDQVQCALAVAYKLVKPYQIKGGSQLAKGNVISLFIPIFDAYLLVLKREESLRIVLKAIASLSTFSKRYVVTHLFDSPNLINFLLHSLCQKGNPPNRSITSTILVSISAQENHRFSQQLIKKGLLNQVLECSRFENNLQSCTANLLKIISNIVVNTLEDARSVVTHPVLGQFLIPCANQIQYPKLHEQAIYILCSLIGFRNFQMTELLLKKYNILQCFILGLNIQIPSGTNCIEILRALNSLVDMYNQIYTGDTNKVTLELERMYNINSVLTSLEERVSNKKIHKIIQLLVDTMSRT